MTTFEPMLIQDWIDSQTIADEMLWKSAFGSQMVFLRDTLAFLIGRGLSYGKRKKITKVISTHVSKSIRLPVVEYTRDDLGLRFVVRDNFYNYKLSVISEKWPVTANLDGLCHTTPPIEPSYTGNELSPVYFEGFPPERIFGYYEPSRHLTEHETFPAPENRDPYAPISCLKRTQAFSAEFGSSNSLWTAVFLILRSVGAVKPARWHTAETHKEALAAARREDEEDERAEKAEQLAGKAE